MLALLPLVAVSSLGQSAPEHEHGPSCSCKQCGIDFYDEQMAAAIESLEVTRAGLERLSQQRQPAPPRKHEGPNRAQRRAALKQKRSG